MTERVKSLVKCRESAEVGVYILLLATELRTRTFFTKLVCDYAVAIVVVCRDIPTLSLVPWWLTSLDVGHNYDQREK